MTRSPRTPWRGPRAAAALGLLVLLPACASVPDSGPVRAVEPLTSPVTEDSVLEQPEVLLLPPEPVPGQSPAEVLRGFLAASAAGDDDHAVARLYLTEEASAAWDDDAEVVVHEPDELDVDCLVAGQARADCAAADRMVVTGRREAVIDSRGAYTPDPGVLRDSYEVAQVDGEWRLAAVPPGVRLTRADVARAYRAVEVGFLDRFGTQLVPERLFLPVVSRPLPRLLVEALLRGPTDRLADAVTTAVPPGTTLRDLSVEGGVVQVDLGGPVATADERVRRALSAQLVATLRQLPDVTGVRLLAEGRPLDVPGVDSPQPIDVWPEFEPRGERLRGPGYVVADRAIHQLLPVSASGASPLGQPVGPALDDPALDLERERLAGLRTEGGVMSLWTGRLDLLRQRLVAPVLGPPSWGGGRYGAWTVRDDPAPQVVLVPDDAPPVVVPAAGLGSLGPVRQIRVSRDDTRVAIVAGEADQARLHVGIVVPDPASPAGVSITRLRELAPSLVDVRDVSWVDSLQVAVIARFEGAPAAWTVQSDGSLVTPEAASGLQAAPTELATAPGQPLLLGSDGQVWQVTDGIARQPVVGEDPFYPG